MAKEVLKVIGTKNGASVTTTISDVNPEATNAQLAQLGTMFNALTTNTYEESNRVTTVNVDTEPGGGAKQTPTLTLSKTSATRAEIITDMNGGQATFTMTTNSDGQYYLRSANQSGQTAYYVYSTLRTSGNTTGVQFNIDNDARVPFTLIVGVTETDSYKGVEVEFNITA